ncbi:hypothetical protein TIFTF001_033998 [Ficus carica]|uniref:Uncharacterized protein n=1 Tax=Ficus carica TaxID=3494 RepID=A0AA88J8A6_FICCA|nr:hypothetical protein TIFTF001_033998 [Ficus carica]
MMRNMVDRFEKLKAENDALKELIKQKDGDIVGIVACIVGEHEKAILKARYELLKEYKQGFFVDVDVVEEIKLYEESLVEAKALMSTPGIVIPEILMT